MRERCPTSRPGSWCPVGGKGISGDQGYPHSHFSPVFGGTLSADPIATYLRRSDPLVAYGRGVRVERMGQ